MPGDFLIGFGDMGGDVNLSPSGDLVEAASRLFDLLHIAEASGRDAIAIAPVPDTGLGRAINDRLRRAAAELTRRAPVWTTATNAQLLCRLLLAQTTYSPPTTTHT